MNLRNAFSVLALGLLSASFCLQATTSVPKVTISSEIAAPLVLENAQDKNYLKISLTGFELESTKRSPINLALVIDRSGSMGGERIEKATEAAIMAVNSLTPQDTLSVIAYDDVVQVIIPAAKVTHKDLLIATLRKELTARDSTALFAGVSRGIKEVSRHLDKEQVNRIILLSDGQANVGPSSISELAELAKVAARKGIAITTMGIGEGYNEDLMTAIAQYSDGNHVFVKNTADLETAFSKEFGDVMSVVAQNVVVQIKAADGVTPVRLLGREGDITGNTVTVKLNQLYSGQEKYVLLEMIPAKGTNKQQKPLADIKVSYDNLATNAKENWDNQMAVSYTLSEQEAKKAIVEDVMVESALQKSAIDNERAIKLLDEGKKEEAKAVLSQSTNEMEALPVSAPESVEKLKKNADINREQLQMLDKESEASSRKSLKERSYNIKTQKSDH